MTKLVILTKKELKRKLAGSYEVGYAEGNEQGYREAQKATRDTLQKGEAELAAALGMLLRHSYETLHVSISPDKHTIQFALPIEMIGKYKLTRKADFRTNTNTYTVEAQ